MLASMLVSVMYVVDRLSLPRTRADELRDVRRRLVAQAGPSDVSREEAQLAQRLRLLREELGARFISVEACSACVRPRSASFPGGHCCSGRTRELFSDEELSALRLAGSTPAELRPPRAAHVGCAFRGPGGCSLAAAHRPCLCLRYQCGELARELDRREDGRVHAQLQEELRVGFERFVALRNARIEAETLAELRSALRQRSSWRLRAPR